MRKFRELPDKFPIYGRFFKIKLKRNFLEHEKKKKKVCEAMPMAIYHHEVDKIRYELNFLKY